MSAVKTSLRIFINQEIDQFEAGLEAAFDVLEEHGRCIITKLLCTTSRSEFSLCAGAASYASTGGKSQQCASLCDKTRSQLHISSTSFPLIH